MVKIGASVLAADFIRLGEEIGRVRRSGADRLHVDVMDGHLVHDIAFGVNNVKAVCRAAGLPVEAHLMVAHPERFALRMIEAGANIVTLQLEPCLQIYKTISDIKSAGAKAFVALEPTTPLKLLEELYPVADGVLLVTVALGIGGQQIIPSMFDKISRLGRLKKDGGYGFEIGVDGGVTPENAGRIRECGADYMVGGTMMFASPDMEETVRRLKK